MQNLKVIENDLVPVYETSIGEKVVYGTELHKVLEVKSYYRDWIKNRLNDCEAVENEDFEAAKILAPSGQTKKDHIIKLDTAKEMAMLERNEKGKQVRRYFIQIEKKYKDKAGVEFENLSTELRAVIAVDQRITKEITRVDARVDKLEDTMNVDHNQQKKLRDAGSKTAVSVMGGKDSPAYKNRTIRGTVYSRMWNDFCTYFKIASYADTPRAKLEEAFKYLAMWIPSTNLKLEINECNGEA